MTPYSEGDFCQQRVQLARPNPSTSGLVTLLLIAMVTTGLATETATESASIRISHPIKVVIDDMDNVPLNQRVQASITIDQLGKVTAARLITPTPIQHLNQQLLSIIANWKVDMNDAPDGGTFEVMINIAPPKPKAIFVRAKREIKTDLDGDRKVNIVHRKQMDERVTSSTPEALTFSTGVFIQRTAHGQGSPYIRGRTGQQTLLLFDGLRLNHALFRKGPNQYLFTVDAQTLERIEVLRGSASVEYGSDAISGAIFLHPKKPSIDPTRKGLHVNGKSIIKTKSGDSSAGVRSELDIQLTPHWGVLMGAGVQRAFELEAGGYSRPKPGSQDVFCDDSTAVPCFREDGRTQVGTGYKEFTADLHVKHARGTQEINSALYIYRQFDAPRTDQCPPPEAAIGECLMIEEQFRTHAYLGISDDLNLPLVEKYKSAISFQRQHQYFVLTRPDRNSNDEIDTTTQNFGTDAVNGISGYVRARSQTLVIDPISMDVRYGYDTSFEQVESNKGITFAQPQTEIRLSRGQYIDGSQYVQHGVFVAPSLTWQNLRFRSGLRQSWIEATSAGDPESASLAFEKEFSPTVWNLGIRWGDQISVSASLERGFRAPNLDDLTARQSTGQGYQLENTELTSEFATTVELGLSINLPTFKLDLFVYDERLENAMERRLLSRQECILSSGFTDQACRANRAPLSLVNLTGTARIYGIEGQIKMRLGTKFVVTNGISFAQGDGAHPDPTIGERTPLSRIPPLNGTSELTWRHSSLHVAYALRWATTQDRLSVGDVADARIPTNGTPGYLVHDLRVGLKLTSQTHLNVVVENLADERYRAHGSGIFGSARSINSQLSVAY
jgi:outer membrane receptor protein involved in Fe transport